MRTWITSGRPARCGNCSVVIAQGAMFLTVGEAGLRRCAACAKALFGDDPPAQLTAEEPAPTFVRRPEFATPKQWAASWRDSKARQVGEA